MVQSSLARQVVVNGIYDHRQITINRIIRLIMVWRWSYIQFVLAKNSRKFFLGKLLSNSNILFAKLEINEMSEKDHLSRQATSFISITAPWAFLPFLPNFYIIWLLKKTAIGNNGLIRTIVFNFFLNICAHSELSKNSIGWVIFKSKILICQKIYFNFYSAGFYQNYIDGHHRM